MIYDEIKPTTGTPYASSLKHGWIDQGDYPVRGMGQWGNVKLVSLRSEVKRDLSVGIPVLSTAPPAPPLPLLMPKLFKMPP